MLDLVFHNTTKHRQYGRKFFETIIQAIIEEMKLKNYRLELSINLVGAAKIRSLNKQYRRKDKATDVLSFPLQNLDNFVGISKATGDILRLGDIFISLPVAQRKARQEGKILTEELAWLTVHGLLHLLGYDHERSPKDAEIMFALQDRILSQRKA